MITFPGAVDLGLLRSVESILRLMITCESFYFQFEPLYNIIIILKINIYFEFECLGVVWRLLSTRRRRVQTAVKHKDFQNHLEYFSVISFQVCIQHDELEHTCRQSEDETL